jgi:hypothetical protein
LKKIICFSVISAIESAIRVSPNVTRREDWLDIDLADQLLQFQKSVEYSGADGLEIPQGKILTIYQLILNYGQYTAYSGKLWHELQDCQTSDVISAAHSGNNIGGGGGSSTTTTRQLSIWIAIGVIGIILILVLLVLLWRFRDKLVCCCGRSRTVYEMSMENLNPSSSSSSSQMALDTSQRSSYLPEYQNRKNSIASIDQPPSYNTFLAEREKY